MPRLPDRIVWQSDTFAFQLRRVDRSLRWPLGFDHLWQVASTDCDRFAPARTPVAAVQQIENESAQRTAPEDRFAELVDDGSGSTKPYSDAATVDAVLPKPKTRVHGVNTLNSTKIAMDFKNIAEEVIANLRADDGTELIVRIEIEATNLACFGDGKVRTASENANTLKFDQSGFEES